MTACYYNRKVRVVCQVFLFRWASASLERKRRTDALQRSTSGRSEMQYNRYRKNTGVGHSQEYVSKRPHKKFTNPPPTNIPRFSNDPFYGSLAFPFRYPKITTRKTGHKTVLFLCRKEISLAFSDENGLVRESLELFHARQIVLQETLLRHESPLT